MTSNKLFTAISLCLLTGLIFAQANQSFVDKVASIRQDLHKLTPEELCTALDIVYKPVPIITADELKKEMSNNSKLVVINVLPERYYHDCHITGSISAPLKGLIERASSWDRSQRIVAYCALSECDAGEKGCILLTCMGFTNVVDYRGGIKEWYQLNYPTQGPALSDYLHTKSMPSVGREYELYPEMFVCSNQIRWSSRYQVQ